MKLLLDTDYECIIIDDNPLTTTHLTKGELSLLLNKFELILNRHKDKKGDKQFLEEKNDKR